MVGCTGLELVMLALVRNERDVASTNVHEVNNKNLDDGGL